MKVKQLISYCAAMVFVLIIAGPGQYHNWKARGAEVSVLPVRDWSFGRGVGEDFHGHGVTFYDYGCIEVVYRF